MKLKYVLIAAAALVLTACESAPEDQASPTTGANAGGSSTVGAPTDQVVAGSREDLVQQVGDRVFFGFDSAELSSDARNTVDRLAAWMQQNPTVSLTVEGHADERGTREYNLALGERRASAVRQYLIALGIAPTRVGTLSYGKERPAVLGSNEASWAQNRRSVFVPG
ncbi:peptidoglycan-associated lipoprotein Pal [Algihabitans albus]|uniref:peptidoglycan-associated lipoprotein Pal n=1 Tax=Algihabitans albus TaxID=2164067 RepID=UPI000E5C74A2|nr:peptidoglycan-associated lipoprotein Pal [Algihabitans albus]